MAAPLSSKQANSATFNSVALPHVASIAVNRSTEPQTFASSDTAGQVSRVAGNFDTTVTITGKYEVGVTYPSEGAIATLVAIRAAANEIINGQYMCTNFTENYNQEGGTIVEYTVEFGQAP